MHRNIPELVKLITSEIRTIEDKKEKWASFKKENVEELRDLLEMNSIDFDNPGTLIGFDIDEERQLILLNYTGQAHNELHGIDGGWTAPLREMRGLIYSFAEAEPVLVSRGFEKFFNANELPENSFEMLREKYGSKKYTAREKADGHMIEYFLHEGELCASTRGKFGTASSLEALDILTLEDFLAVSDFLKRRDGTAVMSIIVELVTPNTKVHVDYDETSLFLLAAYDKEGSKLDLGQLEDVAYEFENLFALPQACEMSLDEMILEINNRDILNKEGWVMDFNGELIKFKYISYIGQMVYAKLSYKYIMNCIRNNRLEKMFYTLPEEIRAHAYEMVDTVRKILKIAKTKNDHKVLYSMYSDREGSTAYFQTVCRAFYKEVQVD
jgi:hypothetical protein